MPQKLVSRSFDVTAPVRIRGRDEPPNLFTMDESLRGAIEAGVSVSAVVPAPRWMESPRMLDVRFMSDLPVPLSFNVVVVGDAGEAVRGGGGQTQTRSLGNVTEIIQSYSIEQLPAIGSSGTVTIILRPDEAAVRERTDGKRPWGHDIVFRDVPVLELPASRPTSMPAREKWIRPEGEQE